MKLNTIKKNETQKDKLVLSVYTYTARSVRLGNRDADRAEVLEGVAAGDEVVVEQSYLIKADIEKAGAAHEH
jgi:cobalt-zinc-cadmium efflux system membrane fusion protein